MKSSDLGQLMMTGVSGTHLQDSEKEFLENENIGGVILFANNYENPAQLAEFVNEIQTCRSDYPLLISVDHEGGRVCRFRKQFTQFPPMYQLGRIDSPKLTYDVHALMAEELSAVGINLSFSPCSDIWTNEVNKVIGDRSFGHDADSVERHVSAAIRGLEANGVLSCTKHFPGHGDTIKDSHFDLPYVATSLEQMQIREFVPFKKAVKARVPFLMMAHLMVDAIDKTLPTSLSPIAHKIVREELRYKGLIITDDMQMKAITDHHGIGDAATLALIAGADIVLYRHLEVAKEAMAGIHDAVKKKKLLHDDVEAKLERIKALKIKQFPSYSSIYIPELEKKIGQQKGQLLLEEIAREWAKLATN